MKGKEHPKDLLLDYIYIWKLYEGYFLGTVFYLTDN